MSVSKETSPEQVDKPDDVDFLSQFSSLRMSSELATVANEGGSCVNVVVVVEVVGRVCTAVVVVEMIVVVVIVVVDVDSTPISIMGMVMGVASDLSVTESSGVVVSLLSSPSLFPSSPALLASSLSFSWLDFLEFRDFLALLPAVTISGASYRLLEVFFRLDLRIGGGS